MRAAVERSCAIVAPALTEPGRAPVGKVPTGPPDVCMSTGMNAPSARTSTARGKRLPLPAANHHAQEEAHAHAGADHDPRIGADIAIHLAAGRTGLLGK